MKSKLLVLAALAAATVSASAQAPNLQITEWMYTGLFGEFTEVVNVGAAAADLTKYSFADSSGAYNEVPLASGDNSLGVNEVLIITEADEQIFTLVWYTYPSVTPPASLHIVDNVTENLGRADSIRIFNSDVSTTVPQDELVYADNANSPFGPRTEDVSGVQSALNYTVNSAEDGNGRWVLSTTSLANTWKSGQPGATGTIGSPGFNTKAP
jgi:hypothetical protein